MADMKIKESTLQRYRAVRARIREKLGTSRITQRLTEMNDEQRHAFANDLLELFDVLDPALGG